MIHHGELYLRGENPPRSRYYNRGRFGRLFPTLPPAAPDTPDVRQALLDLGAADGLMVDRNAPQPGWNPQDLDNPAIPAGFTFFGQFIDHDLTFDPTSSLERQNDPEAIENFRTPVLELDSVYGSGRAASPHLYDLPSGRTKLLLDAGFERDLPRTSQTVAIIGDPRNDENVIVSQLHLAFLRFHNAVVDQLDRRRPRPRDVFAEAQRLVRWHYQWIVVHEFLPHIVGQELVDDILTNERRVYDWRNEPFIPVEFAVAAYRFGHSQVRPGYRVNAEFATVLFDADQPPEAPDPEDLRGSKRAPRRFVDWANFFELNGATPQRSRRIDTALSPALFALPFTGPDEPGNPASLAQRNLLRSLVFNLPSGQDVARAMGEEPLDPGELTDLEPFGFQESTPLWFYILREAERRANGERLGPVGGRIVAEVILGVLAGDRQSYLRQDPGWKPRLGPKPGTFTMADLLREAGVA